MTTADLPPDVIGMIDQLMYEDDTIFPVERGYIWSTCASVQNGNPLFWDEATAMEITGGMIAPPTMLSVWFKDHYWSPLSDTRPQPLQIHWDMKTRFDLPEAVMTDNTLILHEPVRLGDVLSTGQRLRSVSAIKETKLGAGRFWTIDVEYRNQHADLVGIESITGFGYRKPSAA